MVNAQHSTLQFTIGEGMTAVANNVKDVRYSSTVLPNVSLNWHLPLSKSIAIITGLNYQEKGLNIQTDEAIDDERNIVDVQSRYHFISIPLEVSIKAIQRKASQLWLSAGMNYGFLVKAHNKGIWNTYENGQLIEASPIDFDENVGLFSPSDHVTASPSQTDLYLFAPTVRVDATYLYKSHYLAGIFFEHNLGTIDASDASEPIPKLNYTGLCIGYSFR